ncbi:MAG TPA: hypothetical protein VHO72_15790 [Bacteroidales bacterium]|nr:hypothetical protein [Bacteroidales bacterium]
METIITIRKKSGALKHLIGIARELEKKNKSISVTEHKNERQILINGSILIAPKSDKPIDISLFDKFSDFPVLEELRRR